MNININDIYKKKIIEISTEEEVFTLGKFYENSGTVERIDFFGGKSAFIVHFSNGDNYAVHSSRIINLESIPPTHNLDIKISASEEDKKERRLNVSISLNKELSDD